MKLLLMFAAAMLLALVEAGPSDKVCSQCAGSPLHCCIGSNSPQGAPYCSKLQDVGQNCRPGNVIESNANPNRPRIYMSVCPCKPGLKCSSKTGKCE